MDLHRAKDIAESLRVVAMGRSISHGSYIATWSDSDNEFDDSMVQCIAELDRNGVARTRWQLLGFPSTKGKVIEFLLTRPADSTTTTPERMEG